MMLMIIVMLCDGRVVVVQGRAGWALNQLIAAGDAGCSVFDCPAPRWSSYVHRLRKLGIVIDTVREPHGGPFAGHHARYFLRTQIKILKETGAEPWGRYDEVRPATLR
jgi:hypothetical protein